MWIMEEELEREIKNKGDKYCWKKKTWKYYFGGEKMRNARGQQGEASKVKISGSEEKAHRKQATKSLVSIYDIFFHKMCN